MTDTLYCSFCGKSQYEVLCLIAGPTVFICDGCVRHCEYIVTEHRIRKVVDERTAAQGIEAGTDETPQEARPEGLEPGRDSDAPNPSGLSTPTTGG